MFSSFFSHLIQHKSIHSTPLTSFCDSYQHIFSLSHCRRNTLSDHFANSWYLLFVSFDRWQTSKILLLIMSPFQKCIVCLPVSNRHPTIGWLRLYIMTSRSSSCTMYCSSYIYNTMLDDIQLYVSWGLLARWLGHWSSVTSSPVSTWMGDLQGRLSAVNLCPFVGVDLNLWPTVHIAVIVLTRK